MSANDDWFNAYQRVDGWLIERMPPGFELPHEGGPDAMTENTIAMIEQVGRDQAALTRTSIVRWLIEHAEHPTALEGTGIVATLFRAIAEDIENKRDQP